jgi:hypothetical protein
MVEPRSWRRLHDHAALGAGFGYVFGTTAQALSDLNGVILRFIKWDMMAVPHAAAR